jgi:hypothetical protein
LDVLESALFSVASVGANHRLRLRQLRLSGSSWSEDRKEELYKLPLFDTRLFPTQLSDIAQQERVESRESNLHSLIKESVTAKTKGVPANTRPQPQVQPAANQPARGGSSRKGKGRGKSSARGAGNQSAQRGGKQPFRGGQARGKAA